MGRAPALWTEENVKLIKENFVPVSVKSSDQGRNDAVGDFCRAAGLALDKFEGVLMCVTPGGRILERSHLAFDLRKTLAKWQALPAAERAAGAVKVPELGTVDAQHAAPAPPPGCLILKVYARVMMHDLGGTLRHVTGKDLWYDQQGKKTLEVAHQSGRSATYQAQPDHMWLARSEWQALMPVNPKKGDKVTLPAALAERVLRVHLNPLRFYGRYGPDVLDRNEVRASTLNLTVAAVEPTSVKLRLDGFAKFGKPAPAAVADGKIASFDAWGYEPHVLGTLEYHAPRQVFTRFDIVALGEQFGRLGLGSGAPARLGLQPLGIAFELVNGDQPADRIPPGRVVDARSYFGLGK